MERQKADHRHFASHSLAASAAGLLSFLSFRTVSACTCSLAVLLPFLFSCFLIAWDNNTVKLFLPQHHIVQNPLCSNASVHLLCHSHPVSSHPLPFHPAICTLFLLRAQPIYMHASAIYSTCMYVCGEFLTLGRASLPNSLRPMASWLHVRLLAVCVVHAVSVIAGIILQCNAMQLPCVALLCRVLVACLVLSEYSVQFRCPPHANVQLAMLHNTGSFFAIVPNCSETLSTAHIRRSPMINE